MLRTGILEENLPEEPNLTNCGSLLLATAILLKLNCRINANLPDSGSGATPFLAQEEAHKAEALTVTNSKLIKNFRLK